MGFLEVRIPSFKRTSLLLRSSSSSSSSSRTGKNPIFPQTQIEIARFLLFGKVDYLLWICIVVIFLFVVALFQMFLPGSVMENLESSSGSGTTSEVGVEWAKMMN